MHGDVKRIQFYLMGLAIVIITVLQLLLIALNRVAIIENEWKPTRKLCLECQG